ncbi:hypothetical protein LshimejAT787_0108420 [Lyophyllum shimeji]|uniref:Uncharacterized protein n=1 Tax=Lyophyllum shimeji TaxID=47721 RepID=A0A9P3PDP7_LYOSH|nr:hypothetical protein LshimejAT787_0108420 [Lyophyllum shimeji]
MNTISWNYPRSSSHMDPRSYHRARASTSPSAPHPLALMPGQVPQALDRPNLYFTDATRMSITNDVRNAQPLSPPVPLYPAHMAAHFQPPQQVPTVIPPPPRPPPPPDTHPSAHLHRSLTAPPPVPPKPFSTPPLPPAVAPGLSQPPAATARSPSSDSPTDEADIAMALALSESISKEQQKTQQYLASQEEADLARALEASLLETRNPSPPRMLLRSASERAFTNVASLAEMSAPSPSLSNAEPLLNDACDGEALSRLLAAEEEYNAAALDGRSSAAGQCVAPDGHASPVQHSYQSSSLVDDGTATTSASSSGQMDHPQSRHNDRDALDNPAAHGSSSSPSVTKISSIISEACDDEAFARLLAAKEGNQNGGPHANTSDLHHNRVTLPVAHAALSQYGVVENRAARGNSSCDGDEAFARMLAAEEDSYNGPAPPIKTSETHRDVKPISLDVNTALPHYSSREEFWDDGSPTPVASTKPRTMVDDEVYQRRHPLGKTAQQAPAGSAESTDNAVNVHGNSPSTSSRALDPPRYSFENRTTDSWSSGLAVPSAMPDEARSFRSSTDGYLEIAFPPHDGKDLVSSPIATIPSKDVIYPTLNPPVYTDSAGSSTSSARHSSMSAGGRHPVASQRTPLASSDGMSPSYASSSPSASSSNDQSVLEPALSSTASGGLARISSTSSLSEYEEDVDLDQPISSPNAINHNAFVDKELFNGVSIGFMAPKISSQLSPMADEMPLVISLPYGKARPLHLQGPSWRHLLKLMAKLSGTRLEPALSAVAILKTPARLRTVVQFVKPHQASAVWRTILYFTIDYPSPQPDRSRSVNELPYSYSLTGVPTLLRDAADTPISKTYTIPASESFPYPTLPITFPELALYLQAALDESRRYLNDNSSGYRKLAKVLKTCYPADDVAQEPAERTSVGGLFKRVLGRSSRSDQRGRNDDTYELVTPFVQDEWG